MVKELTATEAHLSNGEVMPYGMAVWSTGVGPTSFTTSLPFAKTARGRIAIDGEMRVLQHIDPKNAQEAQKPSDVSTAILVRNCITLYWCMINPPLPRQLEGRIAGDAKLRVLQHVDPDKAKEVQKP